MTYYSPNQAATEDFNMKVRLLQQDSWQSLGMASTLSSW